MKLRHICLFAIFTLLLGSCVDWEESGGTYVTKIGTTNKQGGQVKIISTLNGWEAEDYYTCSDYTKSGQWLMLYRGKLIADSETLDFTSFIPNAPETGYPEISPDGTKAVYDLDGQLWYRTLGTTLNALVPNTDGTETNPVFAYNDSLIFRSLNSTTRRFRLNICSLDGSVRRTISETEGYFRDGDFDPVTRMFYYVSLSSSSSERFPIRQVSLDTGVVETLTTVERTIYYYGSKGEWLFLRPQAGALYVNDAQSCLRIDLATHEITTILPYQISDVSADGSEVLYYVKDNDLGYGTLFKSYLYRRNTDEHVFVGKGFQARFVPNSDRILMTYVGTKEED